MVRIIQTVTPNYHLNSEPIRCDYDKLFRAQLLQGSIDPPSAQFQPEPAYLDCTSPSQRDPTKFRGRRLHALLSTTNASGNV